MLCGMYAMCALTSVGLSSLGSLSGREGAAARAAAGALGAAAVVAAGTCLAVSSSAAAAPRPVRCVVCGRPAQVRFPMGDMVPGGACRPCLGMVCAAEAVRAEVADEAVRAATLQ